MRNRLLPSLSAFLLCFGLAAEVPRNYTLPQIDLDQRAAFHTIVARDLDHPNQYLGHPSSITLTNGTSILTAFPTGHGKGQLRLQRSDDAGKTWTPHPAPALHLDELPTLFRIRRPDGHPRIVLVTCHPRKSLFRWMVSDDEGTTWSALQERAFPTTRGIIVALSSFWSTSTDRTSGRGIFHDYRFDNYTVDLVQRPDANALNGWRVDWTSPKQVTYASPAGLTRAQQAGLCEAGYVASPHGKEIALLFRPQNKKTNAMIAFSRDNGVSWTDPEELPGSLTGERHVARYAPDGRLLICFRDYSPLHPGNPSHGDWIAWVGTWNDLKTGNEGQYRVRLKDNFGNSTNRGMGDCGYTAIEILPDGAFLCISYGHWELASGETAPHGRGRPAYIIATRFHLATLDSLLPR